MDDYIENMETWLDSSKFLISNTELTMSCISIFQVVAQMMWLMDHIFKYTNFGIVSLIHGDFFIRQVGDAHWDGEPECPLWQKTRQNCWAKRAQFSGPNLTLDVYDPAPAASLLLISLNSCGIKWS